MLLSRNLAVAAVVAFAITGCGSVVGSGDDSSGANELELPELAFEYTTEHLVIHSDVALCAGDFARWEGFIEFAENYLEAPMPDDVQVYVWSNHSFEWETYCGADTGGCFSRVEGVDYVLGARNTMEHEFVHALTRHYMTRDSFFIEGLAEALSNASLFGQYTPTFPVKGSKRVDYATAGHFTRWLLEEFGTGPLIQYMKGTSTLANFEQRFAAGVAELIARFFLEAPQAYPALYRYPASALESTDGVLWADALDFGCERDDVRGTAQGLAAIRRLTIPASGFYGFWSSAGGPIDATRILVTDEAESTFELAGGFAGGFSLPAGVIATALLEAGTYELRVTAAAGVESAVVMMWANASAVPGFPGATP